MSILRRAGLALGTTALLAGALSIPSADAIENHQARYRVLEFFNRHPEIRENLDGNVTGGNPAITWPPHTGTSQHWELVSDDRGTMLKNVYKQRCLQSNGLGQTVTIEPCDPDIPTQRWNLHGSPSDLFIQTSANPQFVLAPTAPGAEVVVEYKDRSLDERWILTSAGQLPTH
ncbi:RICIN domain-containing protein [Streptomyces litchfieldiae]|uniref:Ricin B lectin domain-containing protein n=1 Tax=Streptomyces litchfieldiae TaxID=3075543 RepID=A0ABU2MPQ1_9ACTN|nr:ricin-type beta-trefoil lectin domain protein [Streptomyces sp. DSM 44938]MDT0343485.1 hypothetical protein [Streptomyces sp. DSM 44938]